MGVLSLSSYIWYIFGILGTMGIHRNSFHDYWSPSGWSGTSRMSKNWGFGGFWVSWLGFCHCNPTYDSFFESLGPGEYSGIVASIFGHHQDDRGGQECPKTGVLEHFGCLGGFFFGHSWIKVSFSTWIIWYIPYYYKIKNNNKFNFCNTLNEQLKCNGGEHICHITTIQ